MPHPVAGLTLQTSFPSDFWTEELHATPTTPTAVNSSRIKDDYKYPPEKACWLGNVPEDLNEEDLRALFKYVDIISVAFLRRSRCAFVNLASQEQVDEAVKLYHDAVVKGAHLVVRARRPPEDKRVAIVPTSNPVTAEEELDIRKLFDPPVFHAYFIQRAVNVESLIQSVFSGVWTVASRHIDQINAAFVAYNHVWFISVLGNRIWGYARMESEIHHASPDLSLRSSSTVSFQPNLELGSTPTGSPVYSPFHETLTQSDPFRVRWIVSDVQMPMNAIDDLRNMACGGELVRRCHDGTQLETRCGEVLTARVVAWIKHRPLLEKRYDVSRTPQFPAEFARRFGHEDVFAASPAANRVPQNTPIEVFFPHTRDDLDLTGLGQYLEKTILNSRTTSPDKPEKIEKNSWARNKSSSGTLTDPF
jgi:hypothetical protein